MRNELPEQNIDPRPPAPNPQISREGYEYMTPHARRVMAEGVIEFLDNAMDCLTAMDISDPEDCENFVEGNGPGAREFNSFQAIERIKGLVRDYLEGKLMPWAKEGQP